MDANKLKVLQGIAYQIAPACGRCKHATLGHAVDWGVCRIQTYEHQKHSDKTRYLSIYRYGSCLKFEAISNESIHTFSEFVVTRSK
jgi:hypothetical protein